MTQVMFYVGMGAAGGERLQGMWAGSWSDSDAGRKCCQAQGNRVNHRNEARGE